MNKRYSLSTLFSYFATFIALLANTAQFIFILQGNIYIIPIIITFLFFFLCVVWLSYVSFSKKAINLAFGDGKSYYESYRYPKFYMIARCLLIVLILSLLLGAGYIIWNNHQLDDKFIILVTNFDGPDRDNYRVSEFLITELQSEFSTYPNIIILSTNDNISEFDGVEKAKYIGDSSHADIVLWGWYGVSDSNIILSGHLTNLSDTILDDLFSNSFSYHAKKDLLENYSFQDFYSISLSLGIKYYVGMIYLYSYKFGDYDVTTLSNNFDLSIEAFSDVIEKINPQDIETVSDLYVDRAIAKFQRYALNTNEWDIEEIHQLFITDVIPDLSKAININNNNIRAISIRLELYLELHMMPEALSDLTAVINLTPEDHIEQLNYYYSQRGGAYAFLDKCEDSLSDFNHVTDSYLIEVARYYRGKCNLRLENIEQAIIELSFAVKNNPSDYSSFLLRGNAFYKKKDFNSAISDFTYVVTNDPSNYSAYLYRGLCYLNIYSYSQAREDENIVIKNSKDKDLTDFAYFILEMIKKAESKSQ